MLRRGSIVFVILVVTGCAGSKLGKAYQSAGVLVAANTQVQDECERSKAQGRINAISAPTEEEATRLRLEGIKPFTKATCANLALAYKTASFAAEQALDLTATQNVTPAALTAAGVSYVYQVAATLSQAGVKPVREVQDFIDVVNDQLLKARETR